MSVKGPREGPKDAISYDTNGHHPKKPTQNRQVIFTKPPSSALTSRKLGGILQLKVYD